jgi:hypothetical protein
MRKLIAICEEMMAVAAGILPAMAASVMIPSTVNIRNHNLYNAGQLRGGGLAGLNRCADVRWPAREAVYRYVSR